MLAFGLLVWKLPCRLISCESLLLPGFRGGDSSSPTAEPMLFSSVPRPPGFTPRWLLHRLLDQVGEGGLLGSTNQLCGQCDGDGRWVPCRGRQCPLLSGWCAGSGANAARIWGARPQGSVPGCGCLLPAGAVGVRLHLLRWAGQALYARVGGGCFQDSCLRCDGARGLW